MSEEPRTSEEKTMHASDCAVNNEPALPAGPCSCGALAPDGSVPSNEPPPGAIITQRTSSGDFMSKVQNNVVTVLKRMVAAAEKDAGDAEMFSEGLENMLDDIHMDDGFGTEGQRDPRGDFRNGKWSIFKKVEQQ